ncbi:hypothetical protein ACXX82_00135 [Glaciimonas sp. GNP009]
MTAPPVTAPARLPVPVAVRRWKRWVITCGRAYFATLPVLAHWGIDDLVDRDRNFFTGIYLIDRHLVSAVFIQCNLFRNAMSLHGLKKFLDGR